MDGICDHILRESQGVRSFLIQLYQEHNTKNDGISQYLSSNLRPCEESVPNSWTSLGISVIHGYVDDIEAIIDASKHFKYHEPSGTTPFNRMSSLPESKKHLKRAIKERMRLLAGAYISLASFIDDDLVDFLENADDGSDKDKIKKIYADVIENVERLIAEIEAFKPTELPTP